MKNVGKEVSSYGFSGDKIAGHSHWYNRWFSQANA